MSFSRKRTPPVVIGGVGGGGTRVIAQILAGLGFNLEPVSTPSLDNVLFTTFFTLPALARAPANFAELDAFFLGRKEWWEIFAKAIAGRGLAGDQLETVRRLVEETLIPRISASSRLGETRKSDLIHRVRDALTHCRAAGHGATRVDGLWGWKEPNTSIFLPEIVRHFPEMKYIHVIRHGLDMAYSRNVNQTKNWGHLFDIKVEEIPPPNTCLEFWVRSNERAISYAASALRSKLLLFRFDELVLKPDAAISSLGKFLNLEIEKRKMESLCEIPVASSSLGRYKEQDLSQLNPILLKKVREFGFHIQGLVEGTETGMVPTNAT